MADEMAQNQLREMLAEFEHRLNQRFDQIDERFNQVDARFDQVDARFNEVDARFNQVDGRLNHADQRFDGLEGGQRSIEAALASMDTRLSGGLSELSHSMTVQFEKSHSDMKLALEAVQMLDERTNRRFDEQGAGLQEQIDLLRTVVQR